MPKEKKSIRIKLYIFERLFYNYYDVVSKENWYLDWIIQNMKNIIIFFVSEEYI
jgi:hypothetical protein